MKEAVKQILSKNPNLFNAVASTFYKIIKPRREGTRFDRRIIKEYMNTATVKKLHIGSGYNFLSGWLNSDLYPTEKAIYLDATRPFVFDDSVFDYIFSEHFLEHISYPEGLKMLSECHRILKPGGKIRIATPDLLAVIDLYKEGKSELQNAYIEWTIDNHVSSAPFYADTFVINNMFRNWGHMFIYDEKVLRFAMEKVGFINIARCLINESNDAVLRGLEHINRAPDGIVELETFILEGTKP